MNFPDWFSDMPTVRISDQTGAIGSNPEDDIGFISGSTGSDDGGCVGDSGGDWLGIEDIFRKRFEEPKATNDGDEDHQPKSGNNSLLHLSPKGATGRKKVKKRQRQLEKKC